MSWKEVIINEGRAYQVLESIQGTVIPYYYGEALYDGSPALIFSEVCWERLFDTFTTRPEGDDDTLEQRLEVAYKALQEHGIEHGDAVLYNIFEVGQKRMLIDFELAEFNDLAAWEGSTNQADVADFMYQFKLERNVALGGGDIMGFLI